MAMAQLAQAFFQLMHSNGQYFVESDRTAKQYMQDFGFKPELFLALPPHLVLATEGDAYDFSAMAGVPHARDTVVEVAGVYYVIGVVDLMCYPTLCHFSFKAPAVVTI